MLESSNQPAGSQGHRPSRHRSQPQMAPSARRKQRIVQSRSTPRFNLRQLLFGSPTNRHRAERSLRDGASRSPKLVPLSGKPERSEKPVSAQAKRLRPDVSLASPSNASPMPLRSVRSGEPSRRANPRVGASTVSSSRGISQLNPLNPLDRPSPSHTATQAKSAGRKPVRSAPTLPPVGRQRSKSPVPSRLRSPLIHLVRLLILGIGVGAIAGTALAVWRPSLRDHPPTIAQSTSPNPTSALQNSKAGSLGPMSSVLGRGRELTELSARIAPLTQGLTDLSPGVFVVDLDNGNYGSLNGTTAFSSASIIKLPILIAFFEDVDAGKIKLNETLTMQQGDIVGESGDMQYDGVGTQYTALDVVTKMITISDNTATNMLIRRLGGIEVINQRIQQWGLQQTRLHSPLPDLQGTNITTPREMVMLLSMVSEGKLVSMKSRDRLLDIMRHTVTDTLLPAAMVPGSTIAHKTGDIGSMVGDVGIIDLPTGKRYAIAIMVKRPQNDSRAQDLIRQIAASISGFFNDPSAPPPSPSPNLPSATPSSAPSPALQTPYPEPPSSSPENSPSTLDGLDAPSPNLDTPASAPDAENSPSAGSSDTDAPASGMEQPDGEPSPTDTGDGHTEQTDAYAPLNYGFGR